MLRSLSPERQGSVCNKEVMAADLVMRCLVPESNTDLYDCAPNLRESGCVALFVLACRNGFAVCGTMKFRDVSDSLFLTGLESLLVSLSKRPSADINVLDELAAASASGSCGANLIVETLHKLPLAVRVPIEKKVLAAWTVNLSSISKQFTEQQQA